MYLCIFLCYNNTSCIFNKPKIIYNIQKAKPLEEKMNYSEIDKEISKASHGKEKMSYIKKAIELAKQINDTDSYIQYLIDYNHECTFYDDVMELYINFPTLTQANDKFVAESGVDYHTFDVLWQYKWVLENATSFYQISKEQFDLFLADAKRRFIENNYSLRPIYQNEFVFYKNIDTDRANQAYHSFLSEKKDSLCDCNACELSTEIQYLLDTENLEQANKKAEPLFTNKLSCGEEPEITYARFIQHYDKLILEGHIEYIPTANSLCAKLNQAIYRTAIATECIPYILMHYTITDIHKAIAYYKNHWSLYESYRNPNMKFYFALAATRLFSNLGENQSINVILPSTFPLYSEDNTYDTTTLMEYYKNAALDIAKKFDIRNGNTIYKDKYIQYINS